MGQGGAPFDVIHSPGERLPLAHSTALSPLSLPFFIPLAEGGSSLSVPHSASLAILLHLPPTSLFYNSFYLFLPPLSPHHGVP